MITQYYIKHLNKMAFINPVYNLASTSIITILCLITYGAFYKIFPNNMMLVICLTCFSVSTYKFTQLFHTGLKLRSFKSKVSREVRAKKHQSLVKELTGEVLDTHQLNKIYIFDYQKTKLVSKMDFETLITLFVSIFITLIVSKGILAISAMILVFTIYALLLVIMQTSGKIEL
ncbi:hypothetical protein L7E35_004643 [Vibrio parahaemolyticus]|nr:hypothetical protein [Vibrio parahaemolyticus]EIV1599697.1 hypothetical protein [Vibrio parahaemolyticus]